MYVGKDDLVHALAAGTWKAGRRGQPMDWKDLRIGPNSIDTTLHSTIYRRRIAPGHTYVDPYNPNSVVYDRHELTEDGLVLEPRTLYLGAANEHIDSRNHIYLAGFGMRGVVPGFDGRSTFGRLGLAVHMTAGFGDYFFHGAFTAEMWVLDPLKVYPDMRFAQIFFETVSEISDANVYAGAYSRNHFDGPVLPVLGRDRFT